MNARELEQAEDDLHTRWRTAIRAIALACLAGAAAVGSLWISTRLSIALGVGAAAEAVLAAAGFRARREHLARLALDRSAYVIPDVGRYGRHCVGEREQLAAWLVEIVADARLPENFYLADRIAHFAHDLEALAGELASSVANVQPASAVACRRLLTHAVESPLYNPRVPPDELRVTVRRIRDGIQKG